MMREKNFDGSVFDTGTGENISLNEIKEIVQNYFPNVGFDYVDPRPGEVLETRANTTPLTNLGWNSRIGVKEGIGSCFRNTFLCSRRNTG